MPGVEFKGFFVLNFSFMPVPEPGKQPCIFAVSFNVFRANFKRIPEVHSCPMDESVLCKQAGIIKVEFRAFGVCFESYYVISFGLDWLPFFLKQTCIAEI